MTVAGGAESGTDPVDAARRALASVGTFLMPAADLWRSLGADADAWVRFSAHWEELEPDPYAAEQGVHRLRRYGRFRYRTADGALEPAAHRDFVQPPTPEGVHRDGVTLVGSLLIGVDNAAGGESSVVGPDGERLVTTTLREPGTFLLGDDRCTWHGVSPIRPVDPGKPARRDVLVVTFAPSAPCGGT